MRWLMVAALAMLAVPAARAQEAPKGAVDAVQCVDCHGRDNPELVAQWRAGPHAAPAVGCIACHGDRHPGMAAKARPNGACIACHGGPKAVAVRTYLTSKHGVIATIEEGRWDFTQPLADANYRAPTCAYCHFHDGGHGGGAGEEAVADVCVDCHSSRFAETIAAAGERGMEIGRMKLREAATVAEAAAELERMVEDMRGGALRDLRLGTVHHSPDYQWWFGQAALDGDLLRIKAALSRLRRRRSE